MIEKHSQLLLCCVALLLVILSDSVSPLVKLPSKGSGVNNVAPRAVMPRLALISHQLLAPPERVEPSEVSCEAEGSTGGPTCVFRRLYLYNGKLHFVVPTGADTSTTAAQFNDVIISTTVKGNGGWGVNLWPTNKPHVVDVATVEQWAGGAPVAAYTTLPLILLSRLNPTNVYHRIWDDMAISHALICRALALFAVAAGAAPRGTVPPLSAAAEANAQAFGDTVSYGSTWGGCTAGVVPSAAIAFVDGFHSSDLTDWLATSAEEVHFEWPLTSRLGAVLSLPFVVVGSQSACIHHQYCFSEIASAPLVHFKRHFGQVWGMPSALPPPAAPRVVVFVKRKGRRQIKNMPELVAEFDKWGWTTRVVGPFEGVPLVDQAAAFANASAAVLAVGAEMGIAWLGLPTGSCAIVASPAGAQDGFANWAASKLSINVANVVETFTSRDDPRIGLPMSETYQADITISLRELRDVAWCLNQGPAAVRGTGFGNVYDLSPP